MSWSRCWTWMENLLDYGQLAVWAMAAGVVAGLHWHWAVGVAVGLGFMLLCAGVDVLLQRILIAATRPTTVKQRRFPGGGA